MNSSYPAETWFWVTKAVLQELMESNPANDDYFSWKGHFLRPGDCCLPTAAVLSPRFHAFLMYLIFENDKGTIHHKYSMLPRVFDLLGNAMVHNLNWHTGTTIIASLYFSSTSRVWKDRYVLVSRSLPEHVCVKKLFWWQPHKDMCLDVQLLMASSWTLSSFTLTPTGLSYLPRGILCLTDEQRWSTT